MWYLIVRIFSEGQCSLHSSCKPGFPLNAASEPFQLRSWGHEYLGCTLYMGQTQYKEAWCRASKSGENTLRRAAVLCQGTIMVVRLEELIGVNIVDLNSCWQKLGNLPSESSVSRVTWAIGFSHSKCQSCYHSKLICMPYLKISL